MLVRFLGFHFSTNTSNNELQLGEFLSYMKRNNGQDILLGDHNRRIYIDSSHKEYHVGLLLTIKDQKRFCELIDKSGSLTIEVASIASNANLIDFNFFTINKDTGFGMYQYYHQSCSLNSFGHLNYISFNKYKKDLIDAELKKFNSPNTDQIKKVNTKYRAHLSWEVLVRKERLKELIEEFDRVKAFEFCFSTLTVCDSEFRPLTDYVRKERTKLSFSNGSSVTRLANHISNIVWKKDITEGKVMGVDSDGIARILRITDNPDNYGEYSFDYVAGNIHSLDIANFNTSWAVDELLKACKKNMAIFEAKIK